MGIAFWLPLLLQLLAYALQWLLAQESSLQGKRLRQFNTVLYRARELERVAILRGCRPGGVPEDK